MRKRKNRLTAKEAAELENWMNRDERNRILLNELLDDNWVTGKLIEINNMNVGDEFNAIQNRISRSKRVSRIGIILLVCIIAGCLIVYLIGTWINHKIGMLDI